VGYSKEVNGTYGAGLWKHIRKVWDHFASYIQYEVGKAPKCCFGRIIGMAVAPFKINI